MLNVPGLGNSGPEHWQSRWERHYPWFSRVDCGTWDNPDRGLWVERLDQAVRRVAGPVILVAHSLGCQTVAWWSALMGPGYRQSVVGALLVAPADCEATGAAPAIARLAPIPRLPLPFPSILVASRNDPHAAFDRSAVMARLWGSHLVDAGEAGHLNADSRLGDWPLGIGLLDRLVDAADLVAEAGERLARGARFLSVGGDAEIVRQRLGA
jgi:hypothetical protein